MGATEFARSAYHYSAQDAFWGLQAEDGDRYGNDPYSGTIACVAGFREIKVPGFGPDVLLRQDNTARHPYEWAFDKLHKTVDKLMENVDRDCCYCICLGIHAYRTIKVEERLKIPRAPQGVSRFVLSEVNAPGGKASLDHRGKFDKAFRDKCKKIVSQGYGDNYYVTEVKKGGNRWIADYVPKIVDSRRKSQGSRPLYLFYFFGLARS